MSPCRKKRRWWTEIQRVARSVNPSAELSSVYLCSRLLELDLGILWVAFVYARRRAGCGSSDRRHHDRIALVVVDVTADHRDVLVFRSSTITTRRASISRSLVLPSTTSGLPVSRIFGFSCCEMRLSTRLLASIHPRMPCRSTSRNGPARSRSTGRLVGRSWRSGRLAGDYPAPSDRLAQSADRARRTATLFFGRLLGSASQKFVMKPLHTIVPVVVPGIAWIRRGGCGRAGTCPRTG